MACYNRALKIFEKTIGNKVTYSDELNRVGSYLWKDQWKGVFASNDSLPERGYYIINVDKRNEPGSHWMSVCDGMLYDSFGRYRTKLVPHVRKMLEADHDAEQRITEDNCGARSLAWIFVYDKLGSGYAITI